MNEIKMGSRVKYVKKTVDDVDDDAVKIGSTGVVIDMDTGSDRFDVDVLIDGTGKLFYFASDELEVIG